ncbi:MAG: LuxR C-terminal-related transcriptional regulator [Fimbriimonas sp.]|jgi:DNA-binding NarL/FixJ family response regulator|nr:LuxR C-terminal-related transcriptional regulator [Fimbriimonas sp.]
MRIAICFKERLLLDALAGMLERKGTYSVVARESTARALISSSKAAQAQVMLLEAAGLGAEDAQFLQGAKAFGEFVVIVVGDKLPAGFDKSIVDVMIPRDAGGDALLDALAGVQDKLPARMMVREGKRPYRRGNRLTYREYEVAEFVSKGYSNRRISEVSGLREQSVKNLVSVIMRKLQCENRTQVALKLLNAEVEQPVD